jgi:hypothetical protein
VPTVTVRLPVPVEVAYPYLADPRNRPAWQRGLRAVELLDDGPPRVGTRWVDVTSVGARPAMRITRLDPGEVWAEHGIWRGLEAWLALRFGPAAGGTLLHVDLRVVGLPSWAPLAATLAMLAPPFVAADLRRAGRLLARRGGLSGP